MNEMKFRKILIWIGWAVIIISIVSRAGSIVIISMLDANMSEGARKYMTPMMIRIISSTLNIVYEWAIALLCFFAAHTISPLWPNQSPEVFD